MSTHMMNAIIWPEEYTPGTTDNFASNEVIVKGLSLEKVWKHLVTAPLWPTYYDNSGDIYYYNNDGEELQLHTRFHFSTFGFPIEAEVTELEAPTATTPGRIAWHGWAEGDAETRLDVHHAWLVELLSGDRVRILTQESQIGKPAKELATTKPNPMINGHQAWLDGLVAVGK